MVSAASAASSLALGDERLDERRVSHPSDPVARLPCHLDGIARLALGVEQSALGEAQHRPQARRAGEPDDRAPSADVGERLVPAAISSLEVTCGDDREAGVHDQAGVAGLLGDQPAIEGSGRERADLGRRPASQDALVGERGEQHPSARRVVGDVRRQAVVNAAGDGEGAGVEPRRAEQFGLEPTTQLGVDAHRRLERLVDHLHRFLVAARRDQADREVVRHQGAFVR